MPRAGPSLGTGSRGISGGTPQARPLPTKAHNELSFKKAGGNLRLTRREAENSNSFRKLNGEKEKKNHTPESRFPFCDCFRLEATGQHGWSSAL